MLSARLEALNPRRSPVAQYFEQPRRRIWLRVLAQGMEILSDLQPKQINYSQVTDQIAVGGAFRPDQIHHLVSRGVTAVVDCRAEARGPERSVREAGLNFLHAPAPDRHALTTAQLKTVVGWVVASSLTADVPSCTVNMALGEALCSPPLY